MKPQDFFIGVQHFFAILIPGFIVCAAALMNWGADLLVAIDESPLQNLNTEGHWFFFTIISYVVGHILYAAGAGWDDIYEKLKKTLRKDVHPLIPHIDAIRQKIPQDLSTLGKFNGYQWCKCMLLSHEQDAYADVLHSEADQKMFRSLLLPTLFIAATSSSQPTPVIVGILAFFALSVYVYTRKREKNLRKSISLYPHPS